MFSWLGKLFGTDKATAAIVDNLSSGIDKIWYTDQEKAEDIQTAKREANQVYMQWLQSTSGSNLARRYIAIVVTTVWIMQYLVALILGATVPWIDDVQSVEAIRQTILSLKENGAQMDNSAAIILAFYFLGNKGDALIAAVVDRMKTTKNNKGN